MNHRERNIGQAADHTEANRAPTQLRARAKKHQNAGHILPAALITAPTNHLLTGKESRPGGAVD